MTTVKEGTQLTRSANNHTVDLLKFIGSIMIFTMHISAFRDYGEASFAWMLLSRWAVPFFFITSAYFLFRKGENGNITRSDLMKYLKRIATLYFCWFLFNLPSVVYSRLYAPGITNLKTWLNFLRCACLSSTFTGSWYLASCMFSAVFIYLLSKKLRSSTVLAIALCVQTVCVFTSLYAGFLPPKIDELLTVLCFPLNLCGGVVYFALGKFVAEKEHIFKSLRFTDCVFFAIFFYGLYILEIRLSKSCGVYRFSDEAFSLIPVSLFILLGCQKCTLQLRHSKGLRKMSTVIYCCQGNILLFLPKILGHYGITASLTQFLFGALCATAIILIVFALQKSKKLKWAKYLT
ncbi:MAG: acyltransferase family protein [Candidatus Fimenecus sp.]